MTSYNELQLIFFIISTVKVTYNALINNVKYYLMYLCKHLKKYILILKCTFNCITASYSKNYLKK